MAKYLLRTTEVYRVDTELEATRLIEEAKKDNTYELIKYTNEHKVKKEDEYEKVSLVKEFNEEKDPISYVEPVYQAELEKLTNEI